MSRSGVHLYKESLEKWDESANICQQVRITGELNHVDASWERSKAKQRPNCPPWIAIPLEVQDKNKAVEGWLY